MGAAGLTCSTCETASRGGTGIEIDLAKVPKREPGMTPYEIMLSESQERMLIIAKRGEEKVVREIFDKWDVPWAEIGRVTDDGMMRVRNNGSVAAEIPAKPLAEEAPLYSREAKPPSRCSDNLRSGKLSAEDRQSRSDASVLRDPTIASKNWVYRQYDHTVRTGTMVKPGSDAAVFFVRYANKILAATTDCNSLYCALDPREGAKSLSRKQREISPVPARRRSPSPTTSTSAIPTSRKTSGSCAKRSKAWPKPVGRSRPR